MVLYHVLFDVLIEKDEIELRACSNGNDLTAKRGRRLAFRAVSFI